MVTLCPPCKILEELKTPIKEEVNLCPIKPVAYFPNVIKEEKDPEENITTCLQNLIENMGSNKYCDINPKCCGGN